MIDSIAHKKYTSTENCKKYREVLWHAISWLHVPRQALAEPRHTIVVCAMARHEDFVSCLVKITFLQKGPWNFWEPLTADYVAAGVFSQKKGFQIFGSH